MQRTFSCFEFYRYIIMPLKTIKNKKIKYCHKKGEIEWMNALFGKKGGYCQMKTFTTFREWFVLAIAELKWLKFCFSVFTTTMLSFFILNLLF